MRKRWLVGGLVLALGTCGVAAGAAGPATEAPPAKKQPGQPIQIELRDGLTLAADQLSIDRGGRVALERVRITLSGDRLALRARRALVEFDRPVGKLADLATHKLVSVVLTGGVSCTMGRDRDLLASTIKASWAASGDVLFEAKGEVSAHLPGVNVAGVETFSLRFKLGPAPKGKAPPRKGPQEGAIDLSARKLEMVLRDGAIDTWRAEGKVQARKKGFDFSGDIAEWASDCFHVMGDLAQARLGELYILGPEVNIDRAANKAWVRGPGAMQLLGTTYLQGASVKGSLPLTLHWNKSMRLSAFAAELDGGIQAEQGDARLACARLQLVFARPVSLSHSEALEVRAIVCDRDVRLEERSVEGKRLSAFWSIVAPALRIAPTATGSEMCASGPGTLRLWQAGARGGKLTHVSFGKRMDATGKAKTAHCWENVRVLSLPADDPFQQIDLDVVLATPLPEGATYTRCDRLNMLNETGNEQTEACGKVYVQERHFYARADSSHDNRTKKQIVLDGAASGQATLFKTGGSGPPSSLTGKMLIYNRTTGKAEVLTFVDLSGGPRR